jgi:hypothetical protein
MRRRDYDWYVDGRYFREHRTGPGDYTTVEAFEAAARDVEVFPAVTERTYYQVCESYRDEHGRPRQRMICTLEAKPLVEQIADKRADLQEYGERYPEFVDGIRDRIALLERVREQIGDWAPA